MNGEAPKCDYQGYEFGARYLDSVCIDGQLFDADACNENHNLYVPLNYIPCPQCRMFDAIDHYVDCNLSVDEPGRPLYDSWHLVMDIRRNRGLKTPSFFVWMLRRGWKHLPAFFSWWRWAKWEAPKEKDDE